MVRVAFALDSCDREAIGFVATTGGLSGSLIRDLMLECVERRFGALRATHFVAWTSGSLHSGQKPGEQRHGRGVRQDLQAGLRRQPPLPGRRNRHAPTRGMV